MELTPCVVVAGLAALANGPDGLPQSKMLLDILKKLYKKNVELVKENQLLKQQLSSTKMRLIEAESSSRKLDSRENGTRQLKSSISKLQNSVKAREASRGKGGSGGDRDFAGLQREPLQKKRVGSQVNAGKLMNELNFRLNQEQKQRDLEAAVYNAQIYEYEKKEVDWFVEKRYLEDKIASLEGEVQKRNALDDQIENCLQLLHAKMKTAK